jgi:hypothetical protein
MLQRFRQTSVRWVVAALYALTMATSGFAHRSAAPIVQQSVELAAYALPDGTLPPICAHDEGAPASGHVAQAVCDACMITAAPGLVAAPQATVPAPGSTRLARVAADDGLFAPPTRHAPTSRGPPLA